jgi:BirA family biotin operon repressor/biotin-[acetyl-CoA-carboxylase] ligase
LKDELQRRGIKGKVSRVEIVKKILEALEELYNISKRKGFESAIEEWKGLSDMLGSRVKVTLPNRSFEGLAHDINPDGALVVRLDSGVLEKVPSGDVVMIR